MNAQQATGFEGVQPLPDDRAMAPGVLYHYTSAEGLLGIVSTNEIWATHGRSMNDSSEIDFAATQITNGIDDACTQLPDGPWRTFLQSCIRHLGTPDLLFIPFFACFCEDGDLLSQWRAYGAHSGFALGFEASALPALGVSNRVRSDLRLFRVTYDEQEQAARVLAGIHRTREIFEQHGEESARLQFGFNELLPMLYSFKHPAFREEREWRLVALQCRIVVPSAMAVEFRTRGGRVVPYARFRAEDRLPIRQITCGPGPDGLAVARKVAMLMYCNQHDGVTIRSSFVPLR